VGRLIFNEVLPPELRYVNRAVDKKALGNIISESFRLFGSVLTAKVLDGIKELGFKYATQAGITIAVTDIKVPEEKVGILAEADADVEQIEYQHRRGLINDDERYNKVVQVWTKATEDVTEALKDSFDRFNPVYMMATSGARGNIQQIRQLAGMRGLMADPSGRIIDVPIKANFREGLTVLEYFTSTHGARKGLADTALRTADSGYLTRRLVDVAQDVIVREEDCGTTNGIMVSEIKDGSETIESFYDRIVGRICLDDIPAPEGSYTPKPVVTPYEAFYEDNLGKVSHSDWTHPATGELIMEVGDRYTEDTIKLLDEAGLLPEPPEDENAYIIRANQEITEDIARKIVDAGIKEVRIRSVLTCRSRYGICIKCYGRNLATGGIVEIGEAVGIVAAQSIGEPGTQLTMRTFHTGGVAGDDITQGLPRVEELFEARKPKGQAIISEVYGQIHIGENKGRVEIEVRTENNENNRAYMVPYGARMVPEIKEGSYVDAGSELTEGSINPHDLLKIKGLRGVQMYLLDEVQKVYRLQGVDINDKHIEVMVRQMLRKVKVEDPGDTDLLPGGLVDIFDFEEENARVIANDGLPAAAKPILLGITKASLATDSFLSAASFQETTRVLTEAAIKGKIDPLLGLKENVIIGKLIPAGTGMSRYRNIRLKPH
jgi:DNA-directed RNA polymerase subunit beta'